ncbi:FHA domain-containing protein FhaB/FipA [Microcella sp.]|uniref:FHA domain-containing protein FhaB/FipA n=1 Tax=Microcella sp. TaxID=1913979 RepID=UPI00256015DF|nr:FHA domain-containing protein [Microcella sp.]MBX9472097.1 FHA domain-containing protein [Microcella sp.]
MSELTLLLLRIGFLILMWAFVFAIVYALRSDLFGTRVRRMPAAASPAATAAPASAAPAAAPRATSSPPAADGPPARRLVITSGAKEGLELALDDDQLTIGRSADSGLVIRDDYTSTHHARLMLWDDVWMLQDLDSTNGSFVKGKKVGAPTPVPPNTPVSIGTTTFELRR